MCMFRTNAQARVNVMREHAFDGYKVMRVVKNGHGGYRWTPTHATMVMGRPVTFKPGKSYTAHAIPTTDTGGVGFHVFRTRKAAVASTNSIHGIVRVKVYGMVVIHGDGYRAECMDVTGKVLNYQPRYLRK